ncbi:MAG: DUF7146 domain-containing protein [Stellaceae bacterium]
MTAADIARALGGACRSGGWWRCRCPAHGSTGASLALRDGPDGGLIVHCHADCTRADVLAALRRLGLIGDGPRRAASPPPTASPADRERRIEAARKVWAAGRDARGTPVAAYLRARGIDLPPDHPAWRVLRWAPRCWHSGERAELPAMVARVDGPDGETIGVHRTYLRRDPDGTWHRRDRASLGPIGGGAVRLGALRPDAPLIVAEGVESALAAILTPGLMLGCPAWAALSAGGIQALVLPDEAWDIVIAADHDANGTGERAARKAALRWVREGRRVRLVIPDRIGVDPNDLLREVRHAA